MANEAKSKMTDGLKLCAPCTHGISVNAFHPSDGSMPQNIGRRNGPTNLTTEKQIKSCLAVAARLKQIENETKKTSSNEAKSNMAAGLTLCAPCTHGTLVNSSHL